MKLLLPALFSAVLSFDSAVLAQSGLPDLGIEAPISQVACRSFRSNDVQVEFVDKNETKHRFLLHHHFLNGDGRVYRVDSEESRRQVGLRGELELRALLEGWVKREISVADRKALESTAGDKWSARQRAQHETLEAIRKIDPEALARGPLLLSRERRFVLHAIAAAPVRSSSLRGRTIEVGIALARMETQTGEMRYLLPATGTVALPTRRISYWHGRILGLEMDSERLYVLVWQASRLWKPPSSEQPLRERGAMVLRAFWLEDGSQIFEARIPPDEHPETVPRETLAAGPLRLAAAKLRCYGSEYRFAGKALAK